MRIPLFCLLLAACSGYKERPPCDPASYASLAVTCGNDQAECDRQIDERHDYCAKIIEADE